MVVSSLDVEKVSKSLQGIAEKCRSGWAARPVKPGFADHSEGLERVRFPSPAPDSQEKAPSSLTGLFRFWRLKGLTARVWAGKDGALRLDEKGVRQKINLPPFPETFDASSSEMEKGCPMKDKFPGHFSSSQSKEDLWENCTFVFDTNILLNLYRYSDETRTLFIRTLEGLKDRIWIPYKVAAEYLANRLDVIYEQQEEYEKAIAEINKLKGKLENSRQHPFVSSETMKAVSGSLEKAIEELNKNKDTHNNRINSDDIKDVISEIFDNRVGEPYNNESLELIISEGIERYKHKIPPGYSDIKKQSTEESLTARCRPYGDLIIWKSLLEKAKQDKSPVIFVTDDGKEDWWLRFKGKTLGPRPELIEEFKKEVNHEFYMYLPERFLSLASEKIQEKPSKEVLDEIRDIRSKEQKNVQELTSKIEKTIKKYNNYSQYRKKHLFNRPSISNTLASVQWEDENVGSVERELTIIEGKIAQLTSESEHLKQMGADYLHQNPETTSESDEYLDLEARFIECKEKIEFYKILFNDLQSKLRALYIKRRDEPPL